MRKIASVIAIFAAICITDIACKNTTTGTRGKPDKDTAKQAGSSCMKASTPEDNAKRISKQVEVRGEVENTLVLTVDSLKLMKTAVVDNYKVVCQSGMPRRTDSTSKGVLLKDILDRARIKQADHKDRNFYIVARATDGYKATFSWAELYNNATGDSTYVIYEQNGKPIEGKGDMILVCTNDTKTGVRHVLWLKSIEVYRVN